MKGDDSIRIKSISVQTSDFSEIADSSAYDFTSHTRTPRVGEISVLCNPHGHFAAIQILHVEAVSRGAASDALTNRYLILPDGSNNFAAAVRKMTGA